MIRALILAVLLAGCQRVPNPQSPNKTGSVWLDVDTDAFTGCQYISKRSSNSGITSRIAADGKTHMGCKGAQQ